MRKCKHSIFKVLICLIVTVFICPAAVFAKSAPKSIQVSHKNLTLYVGESEYLQVTSVKPENASDKVIWKSKDKKVASVTAKGEVLAKKAGKTEIIVVSKENADVRKSIKVIVKKQPKKTEKKILVNGGIYNINNYGISFLPAFQKSVPEFHKSGKKNYKIIRTKKDYKRLIADLKKNGCKDSKNTFLASYANTKFKDNCLLFLKCALDYPVNQKVIGFQTKFDTSGKLYGEVAIQYQDRRDLGLYYPAVMQENVIVLQLDKKDAAMIDYFKIQHMPYME